jgi:hypothetical protein
LSVADAVGVLDVTVLLAQVPAAAEGPGRAVAAAHVLPVRAALYALHVAVAVGQYASVLVDVVERSAGDSEDVGHAVKIDYDVSAVVEEVAV